MSTSTAVATPPAEKMRKLDPMRAHGAWIYLFIATAAGALLGGRYGVEPSMLAGTSFAGAFLAVSGAVVGVRRKQRQILNGLVLAITSTAGALAFRADPQYLLVAVLAAGVATVTVLLARKLGYLSPTTLLAGVATLTMAAPITAVAGGATFYRAGLIFCLLWILYSWRTLLVAAAYAKGMLATKAELRSRGLREAAIAAICTLVVAITLRIL